MKYVALLSGGKDSCYNLLHCYKNGHELVAAASLGPEHGKGELDSYLYQTVGQDAIHLVAEALEVPLYRRVISGGSLEQGAEYGGRSAIDAGGVPGDETEDMYDLLVTVKCHHPGIQGVAVGAILSNYQRVRVEHVCRRLSLTPLCYLWQRDQGELLSEMIDAGMNAILIKVAGIGLTLEHLGKSLTEMRRGLFKLNELYGSHICGEGGEYETLTLDYPLYKSSIKLIDVENVIHSDNNFAPVAYLRIKKASLCPKPGGQFNVHIPPLLDDRFALVEKAISATRENQAGDHATFNHAPPIKEPTVASRRVGSWIAVTNVHREDRGHEPAISFEDEVRECFRMLRGELFMHTLTFSHIAHINVYLSTMDNFVPMNTIYSSYFGTSPPSRACVAIDLPPWIRIKLECIAYAERTLADRVALHVQGLSYWAPANIGPYSQAISVGEHVFISGQIGLIPSNLTLPMERSLAMQTALSCQHVDRIASALKNNSGGGWEGHMQIVLYWLINPPDIQRVRTCLTLAEIDVAPTLFLGVKSLPKNALIEKQVLLHTGLGQVIEADDEQPSTKMLVPKFKRGHLTLVKSLLHWELSMFEDVAASAMIVCARGEADLMQVACKVREDSGFDCLSEQAVSIRLFYNIHQLFCLNDTLNTLRNVPPITSIPCRFISTREVDDWDYAICTLKA